MPKPQEVFLHVLIKDRAWLSPIGIMGPVIQPLKVNKKDVVKMIMSGCNIYEYLLDSKQTIKLTVHNIMDDDKRHADFLKAINTPQESEFFSLGDDDEEDEAVEEEESTEEAAVELDHGTYMVDLPAREPKPFSAADFEFEFNDDGTVNEKNIPWNRFSSKEERKALRARINEINSARRAD
jgi:hypothetical protein